MSARRLAAEQAGVIEACEGGADRIAIDLMFVLQDSVLVFEETHAMLTALAAREKAFESGLRQVREDRRAKRLRPLFLAAKVAALVIASAFLLELIDPAPMDVLAVLKPAPAANVSGHP